MVGTEGTNQDQHDISYHLMAMVCRPWAARPDGLGPAGPAAWYFVYILYILEYICVYSV